MLVRGRLETNTQYKLMRIEYRDVVLLPYLMGLNPEKLYSKPTLWPLTLTHNLPSWTGYYKVHGAIELPTYPSYMLLHLRMMLITVRNTNNLFWIINLSLMYFSFNKPNPSNLVYKVLTKVYPLDEIFSATFVVPCMYFITYVKLSRNSTHFTCLFDNDLLTL